MLSSTWSGCPMLDAILLFDSTASNVCHNTRLVGSTQAYTERKETFVMIRNCQQDDARIWLESRTYKKSK